MEIPTERIEEQIEAMKHDKQGHMLTLEMQKGLAVAGMQTPADEQVVAFAEESIARIDIAIDHLHSLISNKN